METKKVPKRKFYTGKINLVRADWKKFMSPAGNPTKIKYGWSVDPGTGRVSFYSLDHNQNFKSLIQGVNLHNCLLIKFNKQNSK